MSPRHPVYVVDDDPGLRHSTRMVLEVMGWETKAFEDGRKFLHSARHLEPGVVLLDVRMPGLDGLQVQKQMGEAGILFPVVMMTGHGDVDLAVEAMKGGSVDFLEKPFRRERLSEAIEDASARIDQRDWAERKAELAQAKLNCLTPRERDVLKGLATGYPNKTIAYDLDISPRTVEVHRANIMIKLHARSFSDVLRVAFAAESQPEPIVNAP